MPRTRGTHFLAVESEVGQYSNASRAAPRTWSSCSARKGDRGTQSRCQKFGSRAPSICQKRGRFLAEILSLAESSTFPLMLSITRIAIASCTLTAPCTARISVDATPPLIRLEPVRYSIREHDPRRSSVEAHLNRARPGHARLQSDGFRNPVRYRFGYTHCFPRNDIRRSGREELKRTRPCGHVP